MNKKIVFLDRDGVINQDSFGKTPNNYVEKWEHFHFVDNSKEGIKSLCDNGFEIVIISNQAGVSKGYYSQETLDEITSNMVTEIKQAGGTIKKVFYCTHKPEDNCDCRKPKPGLFKKAQEFLSVDISGCFFVGDTQRDVIAGRDAGLRTITVLTGKCNIEEVKGWQDQPDFICNDLVGVANLILEETK